MPRISEFYGILISMFFNDHAPPHFHARYAEYKATITIEDLLILEGELPARALALVREWGEAHREELRELWARARAHRSLFKIAPLR